MAVVNVKSATITNRDTSPVVLSNSNLAGGHVFEAVGKCEAAVDNNSGSTYRFCSIPSNAVVNRVLLYEDVMDSGATTQALDIGLYETTANGGAVVDADFFASAVVGLVTALNGVDVTHEAANAFDISLGDKMIWQLLNLSSDPCKMYDVVATSTGDNDTAGTILLKVRYTR